MNCKQSLLKYCPVNFKATISVDSFLVIVPAFSDDVATSITAYSSINLLSCGTVSLIVKLGVAII